MSDSDIAPPIVHLARALGLEEVGLTVRDMRRMSEQIRGGSYSHTIEELSVSNETVIELCDLSLSFSSKSVLKDIDIEICAGEVIALMGRNGAGKSSLLKTIVGLHEATSGMVSVLGNNPLTISGSKRRETIGFIPQEPSDLLYGQSVIMECQQADVDNEIAEGTTFELLNELVPGISPHSHPRDLSEGQRLALALSVVLSAKPKVLILDEPTRGLDYQAKSHLVSTLLRYARVLGRTVILATHDVELVAELATRVIFLADGDCVADGKTLDVLLSSPAFAPQVAKVMSPQPWLTVKDVINALDVNP
jgi:energy-coupling factor transport system ATP-binding protein